MVSGVPVTAGIASGSGTLGGTATVSTDALGIATFNDLAIAGEPGEYTLSFGSPGFISSTSQPISVGDSCGRFVLDEFGDDGPNGIVKAAVWHEGQLYVGGSFSSAGRASANNIAVLDPVTGTWSGLGTGSANGVGGAVRALAALEELCAAPQ